MNIVDYGSAEHAAVVAKAIDLLEWPHHCRFTGRAKEDQIRLRLSAGDIRDAMRAHLKAKLPLFVQWQTMSGDEPVLGYIFCPLMIPERNLRLYAKFILPVTLAERDECLWITANHPPTFPCPGEGKK